MPRQHTTDNKHYAAARRELLRDKPPCHWCGNEATEADHLVPFAEGGSDGIENLVPVGEQGRANGFTNFA